jgi:hypothetical protein
MVLPNASRCGGALHGNHESEDFAGSFTHNESALNVQHVSPWLAWLVKIVCIRDQRGPSGGNRRV